MFGGKPIAILAGPRGIFALSNNSVNTKVYQWATEAIGDAKSFTQTVQQTAAAGNSTLAIFARGAADVAGKQTQQYTHANDATQAATGFSVAFAPGGATASPTFGWFFCGGSSPSTSVQLYNFSAGAAGSGTSLSTAVNYVNATGISTLAIISCASSNGSSAATMRYTYGSGAVTGTPFLTSRSIGASYVGNATVGIFCRTSAGTYNTQKYTYSGDTTAAGGTLVSGSNYSGAQGCGNATYGIIMGTLNVPAIKYTYASDTATTNAAFSPNSSYIGSTNDGLSGVNA
jgi:hypothetical protein